jgi:hypothetical protein
MDADERAGQRKQQQQRQAHTRQAETTMSQLSRPVPVRAASVRRAQTSLYDNWQTRRQPIQQRRRSQSGRHSAGVRRARQTRNRSASSRYLLWLRVGRLRS